MFFADEIEQSFNEAYHSPSTLQMMLNLEGWLKMFPQDFASKHLEFIIHALSVIRESVKTPEQEVHPMLFGMIHNAYKQLIVDYQKYLDEHGQSEVTKEAYQRRATYMLERMFHKEVTVDVMSASEIAAIWVEACFPSKKNLITPDVLVSLISYLQKEVKLHVRQGGNELLRTMVIEYFLMQEKK